MYRVKASLSLLKGTVFTMFFRLLRAETLETEIRNRAAGGYPLMKAINSL